MNLHKIVEEIIFSNNKDIFWSNQSERNTTIDFISERLNNYDQHELEINRALYLAASAIYRNPFSKPPINDDHPLLKDLIRKYEHIIHSKLKTKREDILSRLPSADEFESWCHKIVENDRSNQDHPLFAFLQTEANIDQLRQFFLQESPFDMFFSDLVASMQPGHYDDEREEMLENFSDEMGHGDKQKFHRNMRVHMMKAFDISLNDHLDNIELFDLSQLILANYYLISAHSRRGQIQLVGMMLATECMVPGRLEKQITGWLRNGAKKDDINYLIEHVHVDAEHAKGWMNNVVMPLIKTNPEYIHNIALGMVMRLEAAGNVCDSMFNYLRQ